MTPIILHVEDDDGDARMVSRTLLKNGFEGRVERASDGREALAFIDGIAMSVNEAPSLILLDLKLPYASGFEILAHARSCSQLSAVPIVIFTSSDVEEDRNRCEELGCEEYCVKPIGYEEFKAVVLGIAERYVPAIAE